MSVIDSLSAGYRFLGKRLEILLLPILLDLLLWLGPRLSVAPLLQRIADFYAETATLEEMPNDMIEMSRQVSDLLTATGENSNLLSSIANSSLLHVPSLITTIGSAAGRTLLEVGNPLAALVFFIAFSLLGLLIGVVYLNLMARALPIGSATKAQSVSDFSDVVMRQWLMVLLYVVLLFIVLLAASVPVALATALLTLVNPALGSVVILVFSGAVLIVLFYLYFVTAAVVVDDLPVHGAMHQSFVLVRSNFWATLGFVLLYNLITLGIALLMGRVADMTAAGMLLAILLNAYVGSGLTMALLVFYRTRILKQDELASFTESI